MGCCGWRAALCSFCRRSSSLLRSSSCTKWRNPAENSPFSQVTDAEPIALAFSPSKLMNHCLWVELFLYFRKLYDPPLISWDDNFKWCCSSDQMSTCWMPFFYPLECSGSLDSFWADFLGGDDHLHQRWLGRGRSTAETVARKSTRESGQQLGRLSPVSLRLHLPLKIRRSNPVHQRVLRNEKPTVFRFLRRSFLVLMRKRVPNQVHGLMTCDWHRNTDGIVVGVVGRVLQQTDNNSNSHHGGVATPPTSRSPAVVTSPATVEAAAAAAAEVLTPEEAMPEGAFSLSMKLSHLELNKKRIYFTFVSFNLVQLNTPPRRVESQELIISIGNGDVQFCKSVFFSSFFLKKWFRIRRRRRWNRRWPRPKRRARPRRSSRSCIRCSRPVPYRVFTEFYRVSRGFLSGYFLWKRLAAF